MKTIIAHDYADLETAAFIQEVNVGMNENGVHIGLEVPDHEEPGASYLLFTAFTPWRPLMEEALKDAVEACRSGIDGPVDMEELAGLCSGWIARLEGFIEQLRSVGQL